jgi:sugar phosphate isomerase/epimerase
MKQILGATTSSFVGFTFDEAVRGIAKAGLKYIELLTLYGSDVEGEIGELEPMTGEMDKNVKSVKKKLKKNSLTVEAISGPINVLTSKGMEGLKRRIDFANRIGATIANTEPGNPSSEEEIKLFYKNMGEIAEYASEKNVIIAFETAHDFLPNARKIAPVLKKINSEYVRLNYDTANVTYYSDVKPEDDIEYGIEFLAHMHIKDKRGGKGIWDFPPVGQGENKFEKIFEILTKHNYTGPLSIEIEFDGKHTETLEDVNTGVKESYAYLQSMLTT